MHFINSKACLNNPRGGCCKNGDENKQCDRKKINTGLNKPLHFTPAALWSLEIWSFIMLDPLLLEIHIRLELWCGRGVVLETHQWSIVRRGGGRMQKLERFIIGTDTTVVSSSLSFVVVLLVGLLVLFPSCFFMKAVSSLQKLYCTEGRLCYDGEMMLSVFWIWLTSERMNWIKVWLVCLDVMTSDCSKFILCAFRLITLLTFD